MLGCLLLVTVQEAALPTPHPFDRVVALEILPADHRLGARGPSKRVDDAVEFSGTLHAWIEGEIDTHLCLQDPSGRTIAEDDASGGPSTPYVRLEVEPGRQLAIVVASSKPETGGKVALHLVASPETEATRSAAGTIRTEIAEIQKLRAAKDVASARERAGAFADEILAVEGFESSELFARAASDLGDECEALALLRPTEKLRRAVFDHGSRSLPDGHPELQNVRLKLAIACVGVGDTAGARALFEKVHEIRARTLPDDHPDLQIARFDLAAALYDAGHLRRSRELLEKVVEIRSRTLPDDHPDLQAARSNLAVVLETSGDLSGARVIEEKVLEVFAKKLPDDHPNLQIARGNLAVTLELLGELQAARELEKKVLDVALRTLPADHPDILRARHVLASNTKSLGDLEGARELEEGVLEGFSRTLPDDHPDLLRARQGLAAILRGLGDLQGARALQERVLEVRSRTLPEDHPDLQAARLNLATTIGELGDLDGARKLEEKALEVLSRTVGDDNAELQKARNNLAVTLRKCGDPAAARALQEQVLEVTSRTLHDDDPGLQRARLNLAITRMVLGDLEGARSLAEKVVEVLERSVPDDHPELQTARACLASTAAREVASASRDPRAEEATAREARVRFSSIALAYARAIRRANISAIADASSREAEERVASRDRDLGRVLSFAEGYGVFDPDPRLEEEAFRASETARDAAIASARIAHRARAEPGYEGSRSEARNASAELAGLARQGASGETLAKVRRRLDAAERELVRCATIAAGAGTSGLDPDLGALASRIGAMDALVSYRCYPRMRLRRGASPEEESEPSLCAFVLRAGSPTSHEGPGTTSSLVRVELGPIEPIRKAVEAWRAAMGVGAEAERGIGGRRESSGEGADRGEAVRRAVLDPLAKALAGSTRIVIAPDDVLHLVPFDALPAAGHSGPAERLLGDEVRIELRSSLLEIARDDEEVSAGGRALVVGGIDYGAIAARSGVLRGGAWEAGFEALPATGAEMRDIEAIRLESKGRASETSATAIEELSGKSATREDLFRLAPGARFVHVATHGWFAPESIPSTLDPEPLDKLTGLGRRTTREESVRGMSPMLLCGLALAGANSAADIDGRVSGVVTAEELSTLDLSNCDLAVLSACDTHIGVRRAGQGVASLQRAMHMAGARSVITSLWKVPDESTRELMVDFYRRLWIGKESKAQALWEAKTRIRGQKDSSGKPKYSTRDWAAWVLTGDPR